MVGIIKPFLKQQPERAAIAKFWTGEILGQTVGNRSQVNNIDFGLIKRTKPTVFYHNHPFGIGAFISNKDEQVYTGLMMALNYPFYAIITDFKQVKTWMVYVDYNNNYDKIKMVEVNEQSYAPYWQIGGLWFNLPKYLRSL